MKRLQSLSALALATGLAFVITAAAARALPPPDSPRVILVQPRVNLADCVDYAHFQDHLLNLVRAQVIPKLAPDRPNLIVFPEDVGLPAAFIGSRAAAARSQAFTADAFGALFFGPDPNYLYPLMYYFVLYPDLPVERLLSLALTDTLYRAFFPLMRQVAAETGAWVIACTNISGSVVEATDPTALGYLADPDLTAESVYVAADPNVYNTAFVFSPSGDLVTTVRKSYLVETEESLLRLAYGGLDQVRPLDLGFAKLGVVISKDAWMPDILDRLSILGVNTLIQPEAFEWTIPDYPLDLFPEHATDWLPDDFTQSAWMAVQKYSGFRYSAAPFMTGNLFELPWDGQSNVIQRAVPGTVSWGYVGQGPRGGFLAIAPWVIPDPGKTNDSLSLQQRRDSLRLLGIALWAGAAGDTDYVETAISADIAPASLYPVRPAGLPGYLGRSRTVADSAHGEQTWPALATDGSLTSVVVWQDTRDGWPQIYAAVSSSGGSSFGPAFRVAPSASPQRTPAVSVTPDSIVVAWQEEAAGERRIAVTRSDRRHIRFGATDYLPTPSPADEWKPALAWTWADRKGIPAVQTLLAFVQTTDGAERIQVARSVNGDAWQISPADPDGLAWPAPNTRNDQWSPAIAARGSQVAVAWADFRNYGWDIFQSASTDGGATFSSAARVDDAPDGWYRHHNDPSVAFAPDGAAIFGWSDVRLRQPFSTARVGRNPDQPSVPLAPATLLGGCSWRPQFTFLNDSTLAAVWQDNRTTGSDIYLALSRDGGSTFGPEKRVDDGGEGPSYQFSPQIATVKGDHAIVVWEDTRIGVRRIRFAAGPVRPR